MTEHLVDPDDVRRVDARHREQFVAGMEGETRTTYRGENEKAIKAIDARADLLGLVEAYRRLKRDLGLMDFSDQIALAAPLARDRPEVGARRAREVQGGAARRVPGHLGRAGDHARPAVLRRPAEPGAATR